MVSTSLQIVNWGVVSRRKMAPLRPWQVRCLVFHQGLELTAGNAKREAGSGRRAVPLGGSVFGGEVLLAPAEAFEGGVEFLFARRDDRLIGERDQVLLAFDAGIEGGADAPDA